MILGLELVLTIGGLYMLITGKGWGKNAVSHPQYRWLGAFAMTAVPAVMIAAFAYGVFWGMTHSNFTEQQFKDDTRWTLIGVEFGVVVLYAVVASLWDKSIRRQAATLPATPGSVAKDSQSRMAA